MDEIIEIASTVIHDLLTSSLQVVFINQSIDTGTINSAVNCGQTEVSHSHYFFSHEHTKKTHTQADVRQSLGQPRESWTLYTDLRSFTLGS